jgi:transposase InsO family protein
MGKGAANRWQNPYVESLNGRLRDECLNRELFTSLIEAQIVIDDWTQKYNEERPHTGIDFRTPREVFEEFTGSGSMEPVCRLANQREEYPRI